MFRNDASIPAGKLIDELGLKGTTIGGAMISDIHGNFIVNQGGATAKDILALMELIQRTALEQRGIDLRSEVKVIGEDECPF
jgi:UDP-N-acetylenolpyruvoylglucosamine reductase